jgi:metallo-beta-lactamase family protein
MSPEYPQFLHHGAADGVTGSCHRYIANPHIHLLVDCGLFQGREASKGQEIDFDITRVRAMIVTHVHIDHVGRLPYLLAAGFMGPILCSAPSAQLLPLVIEDAFKIGFTRDKRLVERFLKKVKKRILPLTYKQWYPLRDEPCLQLRVRLQRAGHILGSAYVEIDLKQRSSPDCQWQSHRTVFSGDLGAPHAPLLPAPKAPYKADTLIIESTYGNRLHENRRERRLRLKALVERALEDGGSVLIPAFSIGRTQELLYEFESIIHEVEKNHKSGSALARGLAREKTGFEKVQSGASGGLSHPKSSDLSTIEKLALWKGITIIVDSPLAAKFTKVYRKLRPYWDEEALQRVGAGRHPLSFENLLTIDSHEDHMRVVSYLEKTKRPAIVIAASGMAAGGRIVNYLKAMLEDPRHNVLFVGYQVSGTPGYDILKSAPYRWPAGSNSPPAGAPCEGRQDPTEIEFSYVVLDGRQYSIRAGVEMVGGYSAHADQQNLVSFVRGMRRWPKQIRIIHGSNEAREGLKRALQRMAQEKSREFECVLPTRE